MSRLNWLRRPISVFALAAALCAGATQSLADSTVYTYDEQGRLKLVTYKDSSGNVQSIVEYTYDAAGNRVTFRALTYPLHTPTATADTQSVHVSSKKTFNALANDSDADGDPLSITSVGSPSHGSVVNNGSGSLSYSPTTGYSGSDSFTYVVSDGHEGTATGTVNFTVSGANVAPVATADTFELTGFTGQSVTGWGDVLGNDSDVDEDTLSISSYTNGAGGTVSGYGSTSLQYYTASGTRVNDSFTYTISDGKGHTATATVTVHITRECQFC